jgi:hypothetical protein
MAAGLGGLGQQRREALDPPVDGDVVDLDAAFGEQLLDVAVRQAEAQIPADRQHNHIGWEAEAGKAGRTAGAGRGGGGYSCQQCRCLDGVAADATVPPKYLRGDL